MWKIKRLIEKDPRKFKRTLLFSLIALSLCAFLFLPNVVCADWISSLLDNEMHARDLNQLIKTISHVVYIFIWPCLAVAGAALDNSLIYGSFLHLDAALWNIWNIMKNLANFALGFVFIFTIVKNLFVWSFGGSSNDPIQGAKKVIEKTLISWVLVQMSWFIVAALIDLSTILIYAIWWIPLSMLWSYDNEVADVPIMKLNVVMDEDDFSYYYSYGWHNYSPCFVANKQGDVDSGKNVSLEWLEWTEYIVWRERLYMSDWTTEFESWYCSLYWYLYRFKESVWYSGYDDSLWSNQEYYAKFKDYLGRLGSGDVLAQRDSCYFINAYNKEYNKETCEEICPEFWEVAYTDDIFTESENGFKLKDLMEKSKWWVWPFVTMYSSILRYQELVMNPDSGSVMWTLFGFIINTSFALILFIPVAVLMVLLIIRIWLLWIVVAVSPVLILVYYGPIDGKLWDDIKNFFKKSKLGINDIIKLIFLPVVVVFAVSLCIVFLSTLFNSKSNYDDASQTLSAFWIEKVQSNEEPSDVNNWNNDESNCATTDKNMSSETYSVLWLVTIKINAQNYNHWKDLFVWVLTELLATWIVRFFMKFAISTMSEKWKELMGTAEKFVTTIPLIPLPGVEWKVWLHALGIGEWNDGKMIRNLDSKVRQLTRADDQDKALRRRFDGWDNDNWNDRGSSTSFVDAVNYIRNNSGVTYDKLDQKYQDALASMWYNSDNFSDLSGAVTASNYWNLLATVPSWNWSQWHTNSDAVTYTSAQLDAAVKTDETWRKRASGMVAWAVQTSDWVFMVDLLNWKSNTANPWNQQYEIIDRDTYEKRHFGDNTKTIDQIDAATYNKNKNDIDVYLRELQEELDELKRITDKNESARSQIEKDKLVALNNLKFDQDWLNAVKANLGIK